MKKERSFTTKPEIRRHGSFISGDRCRAFMEHCWQKGLRKKVSRQTLEFEFTFCFETNDSRTVCKYIGRPGNVVSYQASNMVRVNRISGKVAHFNYRTTRKVSRKRGLLETLGYITYCDDGYYQLNHEMLPYCTQQITLEVSPKSTLQEVDSGSVSVSIDDLRVCNDREVEKNTETIESMIESVDRRKKEEVIESAHANPYLHPNMHREVCDVHSEEAVK